MKVSERWWKSRSGNAVRVGKDFHFRTKFPLIRASQVNLSFTFIKHIDRRAVMEKRWRDNRVLEVTSD